MSRRFKIDDIAIMKSSDSIMNYLTLIGREPVRDTHGYIRSGLIVINDTMLRDCNREVRIDSFKSSGSSYDYNGTIVHEYAYCDWMFE